MKQSPIRKLRRDRSRLTQELALARGTGDADTASEIERRIADLDARIRAMEAKGGTDG